MAGAVIAGGGPLAAAAFDAANADKVDGRHAVGAGASPSARAGKLVATNAAGRLPGSIIAKARNSARLGGLAPAAYQRRVAQSCTSDRYTVAVGSAGGIACRADRISGGNAQTLQGKNSSDFRTAATRTISVRRVGTALENGTALLNAVQLIPPSGSMAPSPTNPWLIRVEPGQFDLGGTTIVLPDDVSLEGSGEATEVSVTGGGTGDPATAVVIAGARSDIRSIALRASSGFALRGVFIDKPDVRLVGVTISVAGGSSFGVIGTASAIGGELRDVEITIDAGLEGTGVSFTPAVRVATSTINADGGMSATGISATSGATLTDSQVRATSGPTRTARAMDVSGPTTVLRSSMVAAAGTKTGILMTGHPVRVAGSLLDGSVVIDGGSISCIGTYGPAYAPLSTSCQ